MMSVGISFGSRLARFIRHTVLATAPKGLRRSSKSFNACFYFLIMLKSG